MSILNHPVVQAIAQNQIKFTVEYHDVVKDHIKWPALIVEGFSKSGTVMLHIEDGKLMALARYNEITAIDSFDDLVELAYKWWARYRNRSPFEAPHPMWLPHFTSRGWVRVHTLHAYEAAK